jgi:uridine kinase
MVQSERFITIGIAGGSGAGKTTTSKAILDQLGAEYIAYVPHDSYYRDLRHLSPEQRDLVDFDHPDSLDTDLFIEHLSRLKQGILINMPIYDFATHTRKNEFTYVLPQRIILVEGILIFTDARIRDLLDLRIFIEADADVRFIRRLHRDISERGRTVASVTEQWLQSVRPAYLEFVETSKRYAHIIIPETGLNEIVMDMLITHLKLLLKSQNIQDGTLSSIST